MNKILKSGLLEKFPNISHGFLTRVFSDHPEKGIEIKNICTLKQVHGVSIFDVCLNEDISRSKETSADILMTSLPNVALTIKTADCLPLLFYDPKGNVVAAAHAGWRGTAKGVASKTVEAMKERYGSNPKDFFVAIGPSIRQCCYEVDETVYNAFSKKNGFVMAKKKGHWMLDLQEMNRSQLQEKGIFLENIWVSEHCTFCQSTHFYSYRREGEKTGRQWSFIALRKK